MSDDAAGRRAAIAARQAGLVAALTTGGTTPDGVDPHRVAVTAEALLRKRAGEVAWRWPALLAAPARRDEFVRWARHRPRDRSFVEGWEFAEHLERLGGLDAAGTAELTAVRARWTRGADGPVRRRLWASPRARWRRGG